MGENADALVFGRVRIARARVLSLTLSHSLYRACSLSLSRPLFTRTLLSFFSLSIASSLPISTVTARRVMHIRQIRRVGLAPPRSH